MGKFSNNDGSRFSDGDERPRREYGERRPRREFGDGDERPRSNRFGGGDERPRSRFSGGDERPRRSFGGGDERPRRSFGGGDDRPRRSFSGGDERPRSRFSGGDERPRREYGDRRPRREFSGGDERPRSRFSGGDERPRREFGGGDERPRREFGGGYERPRREYGDRRPRREFGGNNALSEGSLRFGIGDGKGNAWGKKGGSDVDDFEAAIEASTASDVDFAEADDTHQATEFSPTNALPQEEQLDEEEQEPQHINWKEWRDSKKRDDIPSLPLPHEHAMAVMGGSFDPIHNGHLMIAKYIIEHKIADEVLFVPTGISPFKDGGAFASSEDRIQMIKLAIEGCPGLSYSDMELNREGKSYTIDTMMTLKQIYPDVNMKFIIGMDNLASLNCWYKAQELVNNVDFIIYPRPGFTPPSFLELEKSFGTKVAVRLEQSVLPDRIFERIEKPEDTKEKNADEKQDEANKADIEEKVLGPDDFKPVEKVREVILPKSLLSSTEIREKIKNGEDVSDALPKPVLDYIMEKNLYRL